ncbi:radical SAM family heme chaperone HemW [Salibacter halophilus]|uniref:Heme chaperone HemW n=1 Tax=Salibacter halophilus TaxID=1803916 RepID=A0A6N6M9K1_9FLAO|nr:radical SAM family heme chaperone HemW [Salibacter halophilus]KAB1063746.1 radical SAM family heme chaperone HemW [Salibacter halophilus]
MAGVYLHIPFCHKACHYCDFHFVTHLRDKPELVEALKKELELQRDFFGSDRVETIYFGGGTPSLLSEPELSQLIDNVFEIFDVIDDPEITLEANPDDLTDEKLQQLKKAGVNRLSIGVQSFFDEHLKWMNRTHSAQEAENALKRAQDYGLSNITLDLIYGLPKLSMEQWKENVQKTIALDIPHISAYNLTVEPGTPLAYQVKKNRVQIPQDENVLAQFTYLMDELESNDYVHYEISNFAREGEYSKHNSSYWLGKKYLGVGPSAHGYDGSDRYFNPADNKLYLEKIGKRELPAKWENTTIQDKLNDYILTRLRTIWGLNSHFIEEHFGSNELDRILKEVKPFLNRQEVEHKAGVLTLTRKGKFIADHIAASLFKIDD